MKLSRKFLALLLTVFLLMTMLPMSASAFSFEQTTPDDEQGQTENGTSPLPEDSIEPETDPNESSPGDGEDEVIIDAPVVNANFSFTEDPPTPPEFPTDGLNLVARLNSDQAYAVSRNTANDYQLSNPEYFIIEGNTGLSAALPVPLSLVADSVTDAITLNGSSGGILSINNSDSSNTRNLRLYSDSGYSQEVESLGLAAGQTTHAYLTIEYFSATIYIDISIVREGSEPVYEPIFTYPAEESAGYGYSLNGINPRQSTGTLTNIVNGSSVQLRSTTPGGNIKYSIDDYDSSLGISITEDGLLTVNISPETWAYSSVFIGKDNAVYPQDGRFHYSFLEITAYNTDFPRTPGAALSTYNYPRCTTIRIYLTVVQPDAVQPTGVSFSEGAALTLELSETSYDSTYERWTDVYELQPVLAPVGAATTLSYTSSSPAIATVNQWGQIKPLKVGITTITVKTANGKTATIKVTITDNFAPGSLTLSPSGAITMNRRDYLTVTATTPTGSKPQYTVTSSVPQVVYIEDYMGNDYFNGEEYVYTPDSTYLNLRALTKGTTTITVKTQNGKTATLKVTVIDPDEPKSLSISPSVATEIKVGKTLRVTATPQPVPSDPYYLFDGTFASSNPAIASVDSSGNVKGLQQGTATITAKTYNGKTATVKINVVDDAIPTGLSFANPAVQLALGSALWPKPILAPSTAKATYTWASSNIKVVKVTDNGAVIPVSKGTANITVKTHNGKSAVLKVTVYDPLEPTAIALSHNGTVPLDIDQTLQLTANVTPGTAQQAAKIVWTSSAVKIATVDENGFVEPKAKGTATITAKTYNGKSATVKVNVIDPYEPLKVTFVNPPGVAPITAATIDINNTLSVSSWVTLAGANPVVPAIAQSLTWTTSSAAIASVTDGVITAHKVGTATITVKTHNAKSATLKVTVVDPSIPTGITLSAASTTLYLDGGAQQITPALAPTTAVSDITWATSNAKIATVVNGVVTPLSEGAVTITAKTVKNAKTATIKLTVVDRFKPTGVSLASTTATLNLGSTLQLSPILAPSTAQATYTYTTSSAAIATVNADGLISPVKEGVATITVKTHNAKAATIKVTVVDPSMPTSIWLSATSPTLYLDGGPQELFAVLEPYTAESDIIWSTSNAKIATVANGVVTPLSEGAVTITAKTVKGAKTTTIKLTVVDRFKPTGVSLASTTATLNLGSTLQLSPILAPSTAQATYTYTTSSAVIATVNADGLISPVKEGVATITVKTHNAKVATIKVTVVDPYKPTGVTLSIPGWKDYPIPATEELPLHINGTRTFTATLLPSPTAQSAVEYTSSNAKVVTVDKSSGLMQGISEGTATITVKTVTGAKTATVKVKVTDPYKPTTIAITPSGAQTVKIGDTLQLGSSFTPNTADPTFTWVSSKPAVATISASGLVSGLSNGTTVITLKDGRTSKTATITITVAGYAYTNETMDALALEVLNLVNQERANVDLSPLSIDNRLTAATNVRALEQVSTFSHTRPDGTACFTALDQAGLSYGYAGENIAMGQTSAQAVMTSWMNSEGHRANILNPNYTHIGIGHVLQANKHYWVQMFISK
ncbi:MAG: Ig-like domain-containing protein [Christensenellaceae bacterium]|jgi:uncharacterized protein YjdB|nr:Ig-like domain-containing protein [Christensenellaceae bacterium]